MSEQDDLASFRTSAERYCAVVDGARGRIQADVLFDLATVLTSLYAAALRLPERYSDTEESERLTRDAYGPAYRALMEILDDEGNFWHLVNSMDGYDPPRSVHQNETLPPHDCGVLADTLAELYLTLTDGLVLIAEGFEDEAVWAWRLHWHLWGSYITDSLRTIHACLVAESTRQFVRDGPNFPIPPDLRHG